MKIVIDRYKKYFFALVLCYLPISAFALTNDLVETREILFTSASAKELNDATTSLKSPVDIFEYVRNNYDYSLYFGARSNSLNTFLGKRGNDVDLASTLIAMYRAKGIPARYAVGTVRVSSTNVQSWLQVKNFDLAVSLLKDQGIQNVVKDINNTYVEFEHVWVEAYVPFGNYRGTMSTICSTAPAQGCNWVPVDPSFKQYFLKAAPIDIYAETNAPVSFDYSAYYNAIKLQNKLRDKNPLEIYEEQIQSYLNSNFPGRTLDDVADNGVLVVEQFNILPASLPYSTVSTIRRYNSVDEHDLAIGTAIEKKPWARVVKVTVSAQKRDTTGALVYDLYKNPVKGNVLISGRPYYLSELSTKRLTLSFGNVTDGCSAICAVMRKDGVVENISTVQADASDVFIIDLALDGAPAITATGSDQVISATYYNFINAGYYLIGTGGETSNWSQVHRAANQLLAANARWGNLTGNSNRQATDDLTGGLLQTAMSQYFAKFKQTTKRLGELNHVITPIGGFVGVVSSVYDVQYVDGTAFSVLPGGLLIDMKGQQIQGNWRNNAASTSAQSHFLLLGHAMSSLEHEIWQELTGYDAVSTVRGIQMAMNQTSAQLINPKNVPTNNLATELPKFGLSTVPPISNTTTFDLNNIFYSNIIMKPQTWFATDSYISTCLLYGCNLNLSFTAIKKSVLVSDSQIRKGLIRYDYNKANSLATTYDILKCYANHHQGLYFNTTSRFPDPNAPASSTNFNLVSGTKYINVTTCKGTLISGVPYDEVNVNNSLWHQERIEFLNYINSNITYFQAIDTSSSTPFLTSDYFYQAAVGNPYLQTLGIIASIRDNIYLNNAKLEYVIPSQRSITSFNQFLVYIAKGYDTTGTNIANLSFVINNWGGGYVDGNTVLSPKSSILTTSTSIISALPTFDNTTLNSTNTIAESNNNTIRTPSTVDPVSTVTGNNYHDETDVVIKGRGLSMAFTRTYNSAPSSTKLEGVLGFGWTHSYAMRLKSNDYGNCPDCTTTQDAVQGALNVNSKTSSITYTDERGGDHNYLVDESNQAVSPPAGEFDSLTFDSNSQATLTFRNGTRYIFEYPAGSTTTNLQKTPNLTARLKQIIDPYGNQLNLTYDGTAFPGKLISVTDNLGIAGRTGLSFTYDAANHLQKVTDWTGRNWTYVVDANKNLVSMTNPLTQTVTYTYPSGTHNLNQIIMPLQRNGVAVQTAFKYYNNGKTFNYADALGNTETLDYDLYRKTTRVTDPRGGIRTYEYDQSGRMTKLIEPDGGTLTFDNNPDGIRNKKTDALGYLTQYSYRKDLTFNSATNLLSSDSFGNVTREQDPLLQNVDTTYGVYDQVATVKDKRGITKTNTYYTATSGCGYIGKLQSVTLSILTINGVANNSVLLEDYCWNTDGTLKTKNEYIDAGNITRKRSVNFSYQAGTNGLNLSQITLTGTSTGAGSPASVSKTFFYDSLGRKTSETLQRRTSATNAALINITTTYEYDALDRVTAVIDNLGNRIETVYDANGKVYQQIAKYKQTNGSFIARTLSTRTYDAADRMATETNVENFTTQYRYDAAGNVTDTIDANGHVTSYEYDEMNRRTAVIDANGSRTTTTYDEAGRVLAVTNDNNETVSNTLDKLGRTLSTTDAKGYNNTFSYDVNNNLICSIDANASAGLQPKNADGCSVSTIYDELNRPVQSKDALGGVTKTKYDLLSNVTQITDAANKLTQNNYDDLGRLISVTDPLIETPVDKVDSYTYDEAGNVLTYTNRLGQVTRSTYDNLNRLTKTEYLTDATSDNIIYDSYGDATSISNNGVTYTIAYDLQHRMTDKTDSRQNKTLSFGYDSVGNLIAKLDYQNSETDFHFDSTNQLVNLTNPTYLTANYQHDAAGRLLTRTLSDGAQTSYTYDANGWPLTLTQKSANGTILNNTTYTRDRVGNILTQTDTVGATTGTTTYTYDALYRLKTADYPAIGTGSATLNDEAFTYDAVGNRSTQTKGGLSIGAGSTTRYYEYTANSNRLAAIHTGSLTGTIEKSYTYDDAGRMTAQTGAGAKTLTWNQQDHAKTINANSKAITYSYDPLSYRIASTGSSRGNQDYYLEGEHLEALYSSNLLQAQYLRGASTDELLAGWLQDSSNPANIPASANTGVSGNTITGTPYIFHHDSQNSVTAISSHDGYMLQQATYSAFGNSLNQTGSATNNSNTNTNTLKYTGREQDADTGLYYYRARYYDTDIGRFISEDPKGFGAGINFYAYVGNNPVNANDPTGMDTTCAGTSCTFQSGGISTTAFTRPSGFPSSINADSSFYHLLNTQVPVKNSGLTAGQINAGLASQPTPGSANNPATPQGAYNNASPGGVLSLGYSAWPVKSYLVSDTTSGAPVVLNVTQLGHPLFPGVVARYISGTPGNYTVNNLGEGTAAIESGYNTLAATLYSSTWTSQTNSILDKVSNQSGGATGSWGGYGVTGGWGGAAGGYLLYPNKANNNQLQSVYSK